MSAEALLWKRVSEAPGMAARGFLPGALDQGLLCLANDDSAPGVLSYRAFRPDRTGRSGEPLHEFTVAGLELEPEFERVARVAAIGDAPRASDLGPLIGSALPPGTSVVGAVAGSDSAVLYAVRAGESPQLGTVAAWWEDAGTLVVLPCRLSVPAACLVPVDGAAAATVPPRAKSPSPQAAVQAVPQGEPARQPAAPSRSRALLWGGGVAAAALAAVALWYSGVFAPGASPVVDPQGVQLPDTLLAGGVDTTPPRPESLGVATIPLPTKPDSSAVAANAGRGAPGAGKTSGAVRPPDKTQAEGALGKGPSPADAKAAPAGTVTQAPAARDTTTVTEPPPPPSDSRADEAELRILSDQSTTSTELSASAALAIAVRAEGLFARLKEPKNRSDAARVVLRASAIAGGRSEACPFLDRVDGLSAREREYFRSGNRCPGGSS